MAGLRVLNNEDHDHGHRRDERLKDLLPAGREAEHRAEDDPRQSPRQDTEGRRRAPGEAVHSPQQAAAPRPALVEMCARVVPAAFLIITRLLGRAHKSLPRYWPRTHEHPRFPLPAAASSTYAPAVTLLTITLRNVLHASPQFHAQSHNSLLIVTWDE